MQQSQKNKNALYNAICEGHVEIAKRLIDKLPVDQLNVKRETV